MAPAKYTFTVTKFSAAYLEMYPIHEFQDKLRNQVKNFRESGLDTLRRWNSLDRNVTCRNPGLQVP